MPPSPDPIISRIESREILDSRSTPTIETTVFLENGVEGTVSVPSGASIGKHEALELRDQDPKRYSGYGVLGAIKNIHTIIAPALAGKDIRKQSEIDKTMIALDNTENKSRLGANAILSVSLASSVACANYYRIPLYQYIKLLFSTVFPVEITKIPTPMFNMINGGKHGAGNLNFQEFHIIPATSKRFSDALQLGVDLYHEVKHVLDNRNAVHSIGDEGGYAPNLFTNLDALEILMEAIRTSPYQFGVDCFLGLDVAASHFKTDKGYEIKDRPVPFSPKEFISYIEDLHNKYHLLILEDALDEDDWASWKELTSALGGDVLIVGDDLLATNYHRLEQAIRDHACSAILLKPNQVGTLSEFLGVVYLAKKNDIKCIVSHRSGETNDTYVADLAVGIAADYVKFGAPARGERVAKYNRLLAIESQLFSQKNSTI